MNSGLKPKFMRRQYLIAPRAQIRFAVSFVALGLVSQSALTLVAHAYLRRAVESTADLYAFSSVARDALDHNIYRGVLVTGLWVTLLSVLLTLWFVLRFSHRFYGPCIPIERLLKELTEGRYGQQIRLRQDDELGGIRDGVNELSRKLAEPRNS